MKGWVWRAGGDGLGQAVPDHAEALSVCRGRPAWMKSREWGTAAAATGPARPRSLGGWGPYLSAAACVPAHSPVAWPVRVINCSLPPHRLH